MIIGKINKDLEPIVNIKLIGKDNDESQIECIVDTGFMGYLCLSIENIEKMKLDFLFKDKFELADGKVKSMDVYLGKVTFDNKKQDVLIMLTKSKDTLIGASLMKPKKLFLNYVTKEVKIKDAKE